MCHCPRWGRHCVPRGSMFSRLGPQDLGRRLRHLAPDTQSGIHHPYIGDEWSRVRQRGADAGGRQLSSLRAPSGQLSLGADTTQVVEVDTCSPSSACSKEVGPATDRQTGASRVRNDGRDTADAGTTLCRAGERSVSSRGNVRGRGDRDTSWHGVLVAKHLVSPSIHINGAIENIRKGSVHSSLVCARKHLRLDTHRFQGRLRGKFLARKLWRDGAVNGWLEAGSDGVLTILWKEEVSLQTASSAAACVWQNIGFSLVTAVLQRFTEYMYGVESDVASCFSSVPEMD